MRITQLSIVLLTGFIVWAITSSCDSDAIADVSFANDIRPILKTKCMSCHGGVRQLGGLSFLFEEDMYAVLRSGKKAIVPGDPQHSELYQRVNSDRPAQVMPPDGEHLTKEETELIRRWIKEGAVWEEHWAYSLPKPPVIPGEAAHPIDAFVRKGLPVHNLSPAPAAAPIPAP